MPIQATTMAALAFGAILAVPAFYANRFESTALWAGLTLFCVLPPVVGSFQTQPVRPLIFFAAGLLLACPLIYFVTDSMPASAEVGRDSLFLATFAIVSLLSGAWLRSAIGARRWTHAAFAATCTSAATFGSFILIALVLYLE